MRPTRPRAAATALRRRTRPAFRGSRILRELVAAARWQKLRRDLPDLTHLTHFKETPVGPVQRDEAMLLHTLIRVIRPRTIVEIGFLGGHSALNFLRALDAEGRLYSFDIDATCATRAHGLSDQDPRFVFRIRSQDALTREDIDGHLADFVFLDASHELTLNQATFERLVPLMIPNAIVAIHDTGTIPRALLPEGHRWLSSREHWVADEREIMPDERAFVNWVLAEHPEFSQIHFHSRRTVRCGLTLLQRSGPLPRPEGS